MKMIFLLLLTVIPTLTLAGTSLGCPAGCICNDDTFVVQCEHSKLGVIPITLNPEIQRLVLRNNKIKTVDEAFQFYRGLQYVDLSSNHLVNIPTKSFQFQEKLQELHLNKNKISVVNNKTFLGLKSLTVLNLRENFLEELPEGIFSIMPKLEELNLGQNRISTIHPAALSGLSSLRILYLDDNLLTLVPSVSFSVTTSLAELHIGLNAFYFLPNDAFKPLSKLSALYLSSGGIANISEDAFRGLTGLRKLDIADNRLTEVPTTQLETLIRLEELVIGQNEFEVLESKSFRGLTNLRKIDVTGAKYLSQIQKGVFNDNLNMETIILVSNKQLQNFEDGALAGLPNLRHLNLRENNFKTVPESALSWNELKSLDLSGNPLHCDCKINWLLNLANLKNFTLIQCATPLQLKNKPLKELKSDDLGCSMSDQQTQIIIVTFCVSATILLAVLGLFLFRYRLKVRDALKDYKFNKRAISRKEHEYQKTFADEEYHHVVQGIPGTHHMNSHHMNNHMNNHMTSHHLGKPIPVTEL